MKTITLGYAETVPPPVNPGLEGSLYDHQQSLPTLFNRRGGGEGTRLNSRIRVARYRPAYTSPDHREF